MSSPKLVARESLLALVAVAGATGANAQDQKETLESVVVTGSRLQTTGFTTPTPVTVLNAEDFERRAAVSVVDVLQEMPAFRPNLGPTQGTGGTFQTGQALLNLRGLGPARTLVLIDGIRHVPNITDGTFDTNVIPVSLISQTEVVTGGASAAYGSDAVAGVVNFKINDRLDGFKGSMTYGTSQEGDGEQYAASVAFGTPFANDRGRFLVGLDWSDAAHSGTLYSRDWGRRETNAVAPIGRPAGMPATILADNVHQRFANSGLITGCRQNGVASAGPACVFNNQTFDANGTLRPFQLGSPLGGTSMVGGENEGETIGGNNFLRVGGDRYALLTRASFDLTDNLTAWGEFSTGRFEVESRSADLSLAVPFPVPGLINIDNPFIPDAVRTQMQAQGVDQLTIFNTVICPSCNGFSVNNVNEFNQGIAGLRGTAFKDWSWDATYAQGKSDFQYRPYGFVAYPNFYSALYAVPGPNGQPVCGPTATNPMFLAMNPVQRANFTRFIDPGCVPFNILSPNGISGPNDPAYQYVNPRLIQTTVFERKTVQANITGKLFQGWAGPITAALGGEWRDDEAAVTLNGDMAQRTAVGAISGPGPQPGVGDYSVYEFYGEAGIPLANELPFAHSLDLNGAIRRTHYSTSGSVTTWKVGATWEPVDFLRFRATRSRDIRAPSIPNLFFRGNDGAGNFRNPVNNVPFTVQAGTPNNPNLVPEEADTWTAGVVFLPNWDGIGRFQMSADWYRIDIQDVIAAIQGQTIINLYYGTGGNAPQPFYGQFITFDPSCTPAPGNNCGGILRVDAPPLNLNSQRVEGVDIALAYGLPFERFGAINFSAVGSYLKTQRQLVVGANGSLVPQLQSAPEWMWTGNVNYSLDRLNIGLQARYFSTVTYSENLNGPGQAGYDPSAANSISKNKWPSEVYFSLNSSYEFMTGAGGAFESIQAFLTVDNLLDTDPPAGSFSIWQGLGNAAPANTVGFYPYDAVGRYYKAGVRFQF